MKKIVLFISFGFLLQSCSDCSQCELQVQSMKNQMTQDSAWMANMTQTSSSIDSILSGISGQTTSGIEGLTKTELVDKAEVAKSMLEQAQQEIANMESELNKAKGAYRKNRLLKKDLEEK